MSRGRRVIALGLGLYVLIFGLLCGMLVERMRFDRERISVVERLAAVEHRLHARLMEIEHHESATLPPGSPRR